MADLISESFSDAHGALTGYDAYDSDALVQILKRRHVDIRTFLNFGDQILPRTMFLLDTHTVGDLDGLTMTQIEDDTTTDIDVTSVFQEAVVSYGEYWDSSGTISQVPGSNPLELFLTTGSSMLWSSRVLAGLRDRPVDISETAATDHFSIALPSFPLSSLNLASCFVDVSYDPAGTFATNTDSIAFTASTVALVNGNSELRVNRSVLTGDLITGIRFRFVATGSCTVRIAAIRILPPDWTYGAYDVDTRNGVIRPGVSRTGVISGPYDFDWPILWRAAVPSGSLDPRPVNVRLSALFKSGDLTVDGVSESNRLALYLREVTQDFMTQLDLNGMTMEELDALGHQPDLGPAMFRSRTQSELQGMLQSQLQGHSQLDLERAPDELASSWIRVRLDWGSTLSTLVLENSEGLGYSWTSDQIQTNVRYVLLVDLEDNSMRIRVYPLASDDRADLSTPVFDSTTIVDDSLLVRRQGRVGWEVSLADHNATLEEVRSRGTTYAEWESSPFQSKVPVDGVRLSAQASPDRSLYTGIEPVILIDPPASTTYFDLATDHDRTLSGESFRVYNSGAGAPRGIETNLLAIEDFEQTRISLSLWYPTTTVGLYAYLRSPTGRTFSLDLPRLSRDQWQSIALDLSGLRDELTGDYRLLLLQHDVGVPTTWWVDQLRVVSRSVSWAARSVLADPWGDNEALYMPLGDLVNQPEGGVLFAERGNFLQVRGRAHRQDAWIDTVQFTPRYAQLGRLVWPEAGIRPEPVAAFTHSSSGGVVTFNGSTSSIPSGRIASYAWSLGDGERRFGQVVTHDYAVAGAYTVTLTVTSDRGVLASTTQVVAG